MLEEKEREDLHVLMDYKWEEHQPFFKRAQEIPMEEQVSCALLFPPIRVLC